MVQHVWLAADLDRDCALTIRTIQRGSAAPMTLEVRAGSVDARAALGTASSDGFLLHAWQQCYEGSVPGFRCTRDPTSADLGEFLAFLWLHDHGSRPRAQELVQTLTYQIALQLHAALPRPVPKRCPKLSEENRVLQHAGSSQPRGFPHRLLHFNARELLVLRGPKGLRKNTEMMAGALVEGTRSVTPFRREHGSRRF